MIQVEHLTKRYGGHTAVDDISFTVEDGCIYGLLGPNGAGKSTTMNIITGYLSATDGTVTINGGSELDAEGAELNEDVNTEAETVEVGTDADNQ